MRGANLSNFLKSEETVRFELTEAISDLGTLAPCWYRPLTHVSMEEEKRFELLDPLTEIYGFQDRRLKPDSAILPLITNLATSEGIEPYLLSVKGKCPADRRRGRIFHKQNWWQISELNRAKRLMKPPHTHVC